MTNKHHNYTPLLLSGLLVVTTLFAHQTLTKRLERVSEALATSKQQLDYLMPQATQLETIEQSIERLQAEQNQHETMLPVVYGDSYFLERMLEQVYTLKGEMISLKQLPIEASEQDTTLLYEGFNLQYESTKEHSADFVQKLCTIPYMQVVSFEQYQEGGGKVYVNLQVRVYGLQGTRL